MSTNKKYTFEDWVEGNIPSKLSVANKSGNPLTDSYWLQSNMTISVLKKVQEAQMLTYDFSVNSLYTLMLSLYNKNYSRSPDKSRFKARQLEITNEFLEAHRKEWDKALEGTGKIDARFYTGAHYLIAQRGKATLSVGKQALVDAKDIYLKWLESDTNMSLNKNPSGLQGSPDQLGQVIYPIYTDQFNQLEKELHDRPEAKPFLSNYKWQETKTALCQFLVVIIELGWTRKQGNNSDVKTRRFFEQRYGYEKKALSDMFKPIKRPDFDNSKIAFHFIDMPVKTK